MVLYLTSWYGLQWHKDKILWKKKKPANLFYVYELEKEWETAVIA
jgi:hypothetical protein